MDFDRLGRLIALRYKLMWARTRTRNGKIALFFTGYLLFILVSVALWAGGLGAAVVAVRSGKAQLVADAALTGLYFQAVMMAVMLGFGMNTIFSDYELRRYPVRARERWLARHLIGMVDPFWLLVLALELGLAAGLYVLGAVSLAAAFFAVLVLFAGNYLLARFIGLALERLMQRKSGSIVAMAGIIALSLLPSTLGTMLRNNPERVAALLRVAAATPMFGAAATMTRSGAAAARGMALETAWLLAFLAALVALERRPAKAALAVAASALRWQGGCERAAAFLPPGPGGAPAPLVAHWLRFIIRNNRFRALYAMSLPLAAFLTFQLGRRGGERLFLAALSAMPLVGFLGSSRFAVNLFGYTGGGFRRLFLLPTDPAAPLRAASYAALLLGMPLVPVAVIAWIVLAPVPFDPRQVFMLLAAGFGGLFAFGGLGLWASILGPRRGNYYSGLGNDLSLAGNVVLIGWTLVSLMLPTVLHKTAPFTVAPENWWLAAAAVLVAALFYRVSLRSAGALFVARRERLLAVVEGRA